LASSEREGIEGQLNHATCIVNALSDIKPEIENVIKMGRKIVESEASAVQVTIWLISSGLPDGLFSNQKSKFG
jgi:uncharacterized protein YjgD (DUF1641 family)